MKRHAVVALVLLAATARADVRGNVWQRATADAKTDTADDKYESEMRQGDETLFTMSGGISISEDPTFRFAYTETGAGLSLHATDTDGAVFERRFPVGM